MSATPIDRSTHERDPDRHGGRMSATPIDMVGA